MSQDKEVHYADDTLGALYTTEDDYVKYRITNKFWGLDKAKRQEYLERAGVIEGRQEDAIRQLVWGKNAPATRIPRLQNIFEDMENGIPFEQIGA